VAKFDVGGLVAAWRRRGQALGPFERGVIALDAGDHEAAVRELSAALASAPSPAERARIHNKCGVAFVALGRRGDALEAFALALDCDDTCAPALVNIGNLLLEDGHALDALDYYEAAVRADETYPLAHRNRGIALRRLGRRSEAVRALRSADRLAGRRDPRA